MDNLVAGKRISQLRQARGLTQQQLAAMMSVSHQAVSKWESGLALPDISTMLEMTRFFGISVEVLFAEEANEVINEDANANTEEKTQDAQQPEREVKHMNIQQLLQMAPFMSKEGVGEIALGIEEALSAASIAKLAPFITQEALTALIEKHKPQFSWETLKKVAPFMGRDAVDALARAIASGEETVTSSSDSRNKTFNDLGRAFDSIGKDMGQAFDGLGRKAKKGVKKAIRFGEKVINEVTEAFNEREETEAIVHRAQMRSERAIAIRKRAFERALMDERWDWIADHMDEIQDDGDLKAKIAAKAKESGMHDWICAHMGGYADEATIKAAIAADNWEWLGENAWLFEAEMQQRVALAAMKSENWQWLADFSEQLDIGSCAMEIAQAALKCGEKKLAAQLAAAKLTQQEAVILAREANAARDYEALELLVDAAGKDYRNHLLTESAENDDWELVMRFAKDAETQIIEKLMDLAVDQGNFEAIDQLDELL